VYETRYRISVTVTREIGHICSNLEFHLIMDSISQEFSRTFQHVGIVYSDLTLNIDEK